MKLSFLFIHITITSSQSPFYHAFTNLKPKKTNQQTKD